MDAVRARPPRAGAPLPVSSRPTSRRLRRSLPAVLAGVALLAAACSGSSAADTPADAPPVSLSAEEREVTVTVEGRERSYLLQPAKGLTEGDEAALVVVLHQEGGTPAGVAAETALQDLRDQGATLAYPAGVDSSWDAGACCGRGNKTRGVDDVAFLDAVLEDVGTQTPVDEDRRALVGYSSGGMLTYRYVCGRPGVLAAAVVVSGSLESECADGITTPDVMALHGKKDGTIGFAKPIFIEELGLAPRPVESSLELFTESAGCDAPATDRRPDVEVRLWDDCRGGIVEALLVPEAGHGWAKLDATNRTRAFLLDHLLDR